MKKRKMLGFLGLSILCSLALMSCEVKNDNTETNENTTTESNADTNTDTTSKTTVTETPEETEEKVAPVVTDDTSTLDVVVEETESTVDDAVTESENVYTITAAGEYSFSGDIKEGSIVVNAPDCDVIINLEGVNITSTKTAPINIIAASSVEISAKSGTQNYITDNRTTASDDDPTAAIYSTCDLKLKGKGELNVYGNYNNGIHSKDDLEIKNETLYVKALNNALKGNDSVTLENINGTIISTGGDGIKTTNTDISSKGNQRGIITIIGGILNIYACCDGIDASYNVEIVADDEGNEPTINIYTNSYSSYSNDSPSTISSSSTLYLQLSSSYYSSSYDYYVYCYDTSNPSDGEFIIFDYYQIQTSGRGFGGFSQTSYYYLKANVDPSVYSGVQVYMFEKGTTPTTTNYFAASTGQAINSTKDMLVVKSITTSTKKIGIDWSNYSSTTTSQMPGGMGMNEGNTDKTSYSTKGIKADNDVNISAGNILIKAYDDGIHASSNVTLENGEVSTGNVNINGGTIIVLSKDDGIHADDTLTINNGNVTITSAYEGFEGKKIVINGGNNSIYATDDGINAQSSILITNGTTAVIVASGDTDAIDSNGTYSQTGGTVISMNLAQSGTATVLDTDSKASITGGVFLGFGNLETTPSLTNVKSTTKSVSLATGTYTLKFNDEVIATFETKANYSKLYLAGVSGTYLVGSTTISI